MEGSFDYCFEADMDGVRVTIERHRGRLWDLPVLGRLIADSYERADRSILQRLKTQPETTAELSEPASDTGLTLGVAVDQSRFVRKTA